MNIIWLVLALGAGLGDSISKASQKWAVSCTNYSKANIAFCGNLTASIILFLISYFVIGSPQIIGGFWTAVFVTGFLNSLTFPMFLRAYEIGEFSSIYSMILLTPAFLFITSFFFLGETISLFGIFGVALTILGLYIISKNNGDICYANKNSTMGNFLGILVAIIWSVSVNFDKLASSHSDQFFAPAAIMFIMSIFFGLYIIFRHLFFRNAAGKIGNAVKNAEQKNFLLSYSIIAMVGIALAVSNVLHNSALLYGFASYTIALKRTGILWGVVWGWLFFKEKNISHKFLGALIAVSGVMAILFA